MRVEEGRLVERECPHCRNTERRAFGETESMRGELASYAIGWTATHEERVGCMTVGLGAGNPGGGSFHIELRMTDDGWGMGLVDEPFEDVPEGGPDLTRDEALAHDCIEYVWFVADNVMVQDRRAWWLEHWLRDTRALATDAVLDGTPVLRVERPGDGTWRLLHTPDELAEGALADVALASVVENDQSLLDVLDLGEGRTRQRSAPGGPWKKPASRWNPLRRGG